VAALATWRVSFLLVREDGPWRFASRLRERAGAGFFGELLGCVKCTGTWVAAPFALCVGGNWIGVIVVWLALAGVTALIDEWLRPPFEMQATENDELLRADADRSAD
jgi:hypothetical protein